MRTRLREMTAEDMPAVIERLKEQNRRDGTSYSVPPVFDDTGKRLPGIPLALVAVDIETGEVLQGHVWIRTVEQMTFGIAPEATACSMREQEAVYYLLRERGYTDLHILVPNERVEQIGSGLENSMHMHATGEMMQHYYRLLDSADNEQLRQWYESQKLQEAFQ